MKQVSAAKGFVTVRAVSSTVSSALCALTSSCVGAFKQHGATSRLSLIKLAANKPARLPTSAIAAMIPRTPRTRLRAAALRVPSARSGGSKVTVATNAPNAAGTITIRNSKKAAVGISSHSNVLRSRSTPHSTSQTRLEVSYHAVSPGLNRNSAAQREPHSCAQPGARVTVQYFPRVIFPKISLVALAFTNN